MIRNYHSPGTHITDLIELLVESPINSTLLSPKATPGDLVVSIDLNAWEIKKTLFKELVLKLGHTSESPGFFFMFLIIGKCYYDVHWEIEKSHLSKTNKITVVIHPQIAAASALVCVLIDFRQVSMCTWMDRPLSLFLLSAGELPSQGAHTAVSPLRAGLNC